MQIILTSINVQMAVLPVSKLLDFSLDCNVSVGSLAGKVVFSHTQPKHD